jgi:hypothetical protein
MAQTLEIVGDGARLSLEVVGYERPAASDEADANWLVCRAHIRVGSFEGGMERTIETRDLVSFRDEIRAALPDLRGTASFRPIEDWITIEANFSATGHVRVTGSLTDGVSGLATLQFGFDTDQTVLAAVARALDHLTAAFPVRGTREAR